jgi:gliding motility-associated-like protein
MNRDLQALALLKGRVSLRTKARRKANLLLFFVFADAFTKEPAQCAVPTAEDSESVFRNNASDQREIYSRRILFFLVFLLSVMLSTLAKAQLGATPTLTQYSFNLPFAIDGNVTRQLTGPTDPGDWTSSTFPVGGIFSPVNGQGSTYPITLTQHVVDNFNGNDDIFGSGAKAKDNPTTQWLWTTGSAGGKEDVNNALFHSGKDAANNTWVMLAADRLSQSGTSYIDFEFLQAPLYRNTGGTFTSLASNATGGRTLNDIMVTVEYTNGGNSPQVYYYKWQPIVPSGYDWVPFFPGTGSAFVATNIVTTAVPFGAFGSTTYPAYAYVEVAINATAFITLANPCASAGFSTLFIKTKASNSATAVLKDLVGPIQLSFGTGLNVSAAASPILCNGGTSNITVTATGGAGSNQYSLNGGPYQTSNIFTVPAGGPYTIAVQDGNYCTDTTNSITISQPTVLQGSVMGQTNIMCYGASSGSVTASASGGTPPYSYSWNTTPAQSTATASNLPAGMYTVTITDSNGCTTTASATITQPASPVTANITAQTNVLCYGAATGTATVTANGGTLPYSYSWNTIPVQSSATATNLLAGTYTVTVTDMNGCVQAASATITQPSVYAVSIANTTNILCYGNATGSISASVNGGVAPYSYSWNSSPVQTTPIATNLAAGSYVVTVTDANGCVQSASATLSQPSTPITVSTYVTNVSCFGNSTGTVSVSTSGGTAPYTYAWNTSPVQTSTTVANLSAGTYVVTITDANGCTQTASAAVTQPAAALNGNITGQTNVLCYGNATGTATVTTTGGTSPYIYSWNTTPTQTTATAINLAAGIYTVTITDASGCVQTKAITITQPSTGLTAAITGQTNVLCYGNASGAATVTAAGGTAPYTYSWNTIPVQTASTASNLMAGTYTVTVTDANGCTKTASVTITQPSAPLTANMTSQINVACLGNSTGSATVIAAGGTPPYSYSWNSAPAQTAATANNLPAGTYTVTITDINSCVQNAQATITQPTAALTASISSVSNVSCFGNSTGSAIVTPAGGTAPYTYSWNTTPVQTTAAATNLPAGTYMVTIVDSKGCSQTASTTITQPAASVSATITAQTNILCFGNSTGSATVSAAGGVSPYTYSWNTSPAQVSATATNIPAGVYTVTVTDANGCIQTATATLTQPATPVIANITASTNVLCYGNATGTATVTPGGGTAPYTYSWNTTPVQTTPTATIMAAGVYVVSVTDANGCSQTASVTIIQPSAPLSSNISGQTNVNCYGYSTGSATVVATGGTAPYIYSWNTTPVQTTAMASNLPAGTYSVTVTDAYGCSSISTATISQPTSFTSAITSTTNIVCFGGNNGSATAIANGGVSPYTYAWNSVPPQTAPTANNLVAGTYTVTVTDANGCNSSAVATITQPNALTPTISVANLYCLGATNASATVTMAGGTPPYTYSWNTTPVQTTATASNLPVGNYTVTVTDANSCSVTAAAVVATPAFPLSVSMGTVNPVLCNTGSTGSATVVVSGGATPYTYSWNSVPSQATATASNLPAGTYTVTVTDNYGCTGSASATITQPSSALNAAVSSQTNVLCFGNSTGAATVIANGGTPPYAYSWTTTPVQTVATATGLATGTYTVTVTDANGCTKTVAPVISQPAQPLSAAITGQTNILCYGTATGNATVSANGGTAPYTYSWNTTPIQTGITASGLTAGTYTVTVTDANGCTQTATAIITQPTGPLTAGISGQTHVLCYGNATGTASVTAAGGTAPYTYSWNTTPVQTSSTATFLGAGTYTVMVSDANGCVQFTSVTINQPSGPLTSNISDSINVNCYNYTTGSATVSATGGTLPYSYLWNTTPVQTTATANNLGAGTYTVTVTDANGCTSTKSVTITQPTAFNAAVVSTTDVLCFGGNNGNISINVSGGVVPYTYSWNSTPGQNTPTANNLAAGSYVVTVTDANGCIASATALINQPAALNPSVSVANLNCLGATNASATVSMSGGTAPYTYAWNTTPVQTSSTATNLSVGTYAVTITDGNGCTITTNAVVSTPAFPLNASIGNFIPVSCYGGNNGSATALAVGGAAPYSYSWNTSPTQTAAAAITLSAGTYTVIVTDNFGCTDTASVIIDQPDSALIAAISSTDILCNGFSSGSAVVTATGGTSPYTYSWNSTPAQVSPVAANLPAGTYIATVTDANGCTATPSVTLTQPTSLNASIASSTNILCNGGNNGNAAVNVTGGVTPYTYAWNTTPAQTTDTAINLQAGIYTVTVTDSNGCIDTAMVQILQPAPLVAVPAVANVSCYLGSNGSISTNVTGGTAPYTYTWNTTPAATSTGINNLPAGSYSVQVSDINGCTTLISAVVSQPAFALTVVPGNVTNVNCYGGTSGSGTVIASGGTAPYSYTWNTSPVQTTSTAAGLTAGTYNVIVTDVNGCTEDTSVIITEPTELIVTTADLNKTCIGLAQGSAYVTMSGGTAPYGIVWSTSPAQTTDTIRNLANGSYIVTIIDGNGCYKTSSVYIDTYSAANVEASADKILCDGESVALEATGAQFYSWSPAGTLSCPTCGTTMASPTNTTTYQVIGIDENNCRDSDVVKVEVLHHGPVDIGPDIHICEGAGVQLYATGGVQYSWSPSETLDNSNIAKPYAKPTDTTEYTVVITQNQCFSDTLSQMVYVHPIPTVDVGADYTGFPGTKHQINAVATDAAKISWTPSTWLSCDDCYDPVATLENTITYTATVTSEGGCTASDDLTITVKCDDAMLYVPNTFTPNGDGNNDYFYPTGYGIRTITRFTVYNRWGQVMYEMKNFQPNEISYGWDGRYKGDALTPDVYVYIIEGICTLNQHIFVKGDISLIR